MIFRCLYGKWTSFRAFIQLKRRQEIRDYHPSLKASRCFWRLTVVLFCNCRGVFWCSPHLHALRFASFFCINAAYILFFMYIYAKISIEWYHGLEGLFRENDSYQANGNWKLCMVSILLWSVLYFKSASFQIKIRRIFFF